jgi:hypothetical protein
MVRCVVARSPVAIYEARRKVLDGELASLTDEHENIERLIEHLQRRRELLDGRFELLVAERDLLDERLWRHHEPSPLQPRPPVVEGGGPSPKPRDLAPEPWDFEALELAMAS